MYRYHYPAIHTAWRTLRRIFYAITGLVLFSATVELARAGLLLRRIHPLLGYGFAVGVLLVASWIAWRALTRRHDRQTLFAPARPAGSRLRHADLETYCNYLVHRLKRLSLSRHLDEATRLKVRQKAYDIEGLLGSHPLIEDLTRAITRTEMEILEPVLALLDQEAEKIGRSKIQSVIEDSVKPPFPVITPLVVLYHQLTLCTAITDLYLGQVSLREYRRVLKDVFDTIRGGDFFRIGQRLFEGVYLNSPPLGRAVDDLGQAITCTWLTWTSTQAAAYRCRTLVPWQLEQSVEWLDSGTAASLAVVRETVINDVLPMLKMRIRHSVGPGVADATGFSESVVQGIARSVENVVQGLRAQHPEKAVQRSRATYVGLQPFIEKPDVSPATASLAWKRRGPFGFIRRWIERLRYSRRSKELYE